MKTCKLCKTVKPFSEFFRKKDTRDGYQSRCKVCDKVQVAKYLASNPEKKKAYSTSFYLRCDKVKRGVKVKEWNLVNRERYLEIQRRSKAKARTADPEANRARVKAWQEANPEVYRERLKVAVSKWMRDNRGKMNAAGARRRAKKIQATPAWINHEKVAEFYFAADFLGMVTGEWHHVDHIVPLQSDVVCGLHWEGNLQVLSAPENLTKSNRHII